MKLSKQGKNFTPHEEGTFQGVIVDVTPLVKRESKFGAREEFRIVFETDGPSREDGSAPCVWSRGFTPTLNEKANLRKFLRQWRGRDLLPAEEAELDTEDFIGQCASLVIIHDHAENGETYANIAACTPCKGKCIKASGKFVRKKDREANGEEASYRNAAKTDTEEHEGVDDTKAGADWSKVRVHVGKHAGVELRDLDSDAITKLVTNWLPVHEQNKKPTADDKRLSAALKLAEEAILEGAEAKEDF